MTISEDEEDANLAHFLESEVLSISDEDEVHHLSSSPPFNNNVQDDEDGTEEVEGENSCLSPLSSNNNTNKRLRELPDSNVGGCVTHHQGEPGAEKKKRQKEPFTTTSTSNTTQDDDDQTQNARRFPSRQILMLKCSTLGSNFSMIPSELFHNILKFLSSEDLIACSCVCKYLNFAASDESLWRRLYCMRWGLLSPTNKLRECAWKKLYIQRDEEDMAEFVRNTPSEFKEYYIQMQAAKRSQAPLPSQVNDDHIILNKTVADQVSIWRTSRGLPDEVVTGHACSGDTCSYYQIGELFLCEKTGRVHVCDDTCREVVLDASSGTLVCTISGHCFDRLLSPSEIEPDAEQQGGGTDEAEPFMGSGRFARAYLLGYNCADEKELEAVSRFC
ncbi:F-box protein SKIP31-like isoform X1 [Papaver somniferum]|uniref:F-box protein SKIP31-like isoform X1 n=1 Tax=Papaver somniferum TaxID=3469 RepID=UPI000E700375|nr:F-box protein SKIP31-like isoform X1 [Papaver somniferum]